MAEGDITFYNSFKKHISDNPVNWDTDTIQVSLHAAYTPNIDTHEFFDDVSATEINYANYVADGYTLTPTTPTVDTTNDWAEYDADDAAWTALGAGAISHAIIWKDTTVAATSVLIAYVELGTAANGGDYTISWHADGVFKVV